MIGNTDMTSKDDNNKSHKEREKAIEWMLRSRPASSPTRQTQPPQFFSFLAQNITTTATVCAMTSCVLHTTLWVYYDVKYGKARPPLSRSCWYCSSSSRNSRVRGRVRIVFSIAKYYNRFCYCSTTRDLCFFSFFSFLFFREGGRGVCRRRGRERERVRASERFILFVFEDARAAA